MQCAADKPLKAEGDPIVIGFQNPEGDPNGSFPEASLAAQAAVEYINNELGGLGADIQNGVPGRPIKLEVCKMAISPDDSQRCANELIAKEPALVVSRASTSSATTSRSTQQAKIPVIVGTPITVGDFTSPGRVLDRRRRRLPRRPHRRWCTSPRTSSKGTRVGDPVGGHASRRGLLLRPRGQAAGRAQRQGQGHLDGGRVACPT